jgi:hypothetical protein
VVGALQSIPHLISTVKIESNLSQEKLISYIWAKKEIIRRKEIEFSEHDSRGPETTMKLKRGAVNI